MSTSLLLQPKSFAALTNAARSFESVKNFVKFISIDCYFYFNRLEYGDLRLLTRLSSLEPSNMLTILFRKMQKLRP